MTDIIELKLCPFCGEPGGIWYINTPSGNLVACNNAACPMCQQALFKVHDWNNRPIENALRSELNELKEAYINRANRLWEIIGPTTLWGDDLITSIGNQFAALRKQVKDLTGKKPAHDVCTHGYAWDECPDCRH